MSDSDTPTDGRAHAQAPAEGATDASAVPENEEVPGVPDASDALEDDGSDEPGANATGVGV
ncbi:MAG: hypothetical protein M3Y52_00990 [Actinomycetota bacterium]|nr:hypothetical protein [Actinomycetota bacterium]